MAVPRTSPIYKWSRTKFQELENRSQWQGQQSKICGPCLHRQGFEISDAPLGEVPILFDEVILYTADLCRRESLDPVDAALADRNLGVPPLPLNLPSHCPFGGRRSRDWGIHIHVLQMQREEPARVIQEIVGTYKANRDC